MSVFDINVFALLLFISDTCKFVKVVILRVTDNNYGEIYAQYNVEQNISFYYQQLYFNKE